MFDLPEAKRVRREDLGSVSPESSPDRELQQLFLERATTQFDYSTETRTVEESPPEKEGDLNGSEFEFNLFASSAKTPAARIRVISPDRGGSQPGLLRGRPRAFYFKDTPSLRAQTRLKEVALTGEEVFAKSKLPCPGLRLPWRVTVVPQGSHRVKPVPEEDFATAKKRRKGKKARISIRKQHVKSLELARIAAIAAQDKELAERMKKSKKNRDKKLRQREKEKAKKAAVRAEKSSVEEENE